MMSLRHARRLMGRFQFFADSPASELPDAPHSYLCEENGFLVCVRCKVIIDPERKKLKRKKLFYDSILSRMTDPTLPLSEHFIDVHATTAPVTVLQMADSKSLKNVSSLSEITVAFKLLDAAVIGRECPVCKRVFGEPDSFRRHADRHHKGLELVPDIAHVQLIKRRPNQYRKIRVPVVAATAAQQIYSAAVDIHFPAMGQSVNQLDFFSRVAMRLPNRFIVQTDVDEPAKLRNLICIHRGFQSEKVSSSVIFGWQKPLASLGVGSQNDCVPNSRCIRIASDWLEH